MVRDAKNSPVQKLKTQRRISTHLDKGVSGVLLPPRFGARRISRYRKVLLIALSGVLYIST